jgi:protein-tyrosine-phosphatase
MAEAIARQTASDVIVAASAGTMALGFVAPPTLRVLEDRGINVAGLSSKPITRETRSNAEIIINMTGAPANRVFSAEELKTEDWLVTDPYGERIEAYRDTCDEIEARMTEFAARLRAKRTSTAESPARKK